jgi:hypothetical protein
MEIVILFQRIMLDDVLTSRTTVNLTSEACANISDILVNQKYGGYFDVFGLWPRFDLIVDLIWGIMFISHRGIRLPVTGQPTVLRSSNSGPDQYVSARLTYVTGSMMIPDPDNPQVSIFFLCMIGSTNFLIRNSSNSILSIG